MIRHVAWDWNGTLLDDAPACVEALNSMLRRRGMPEVTVEAYREFFRFPVQAYYEGLGFRFDDEDWEGVTREYHVLYEASCARARLREASVRVLDAVKAEGILMSVLSACERSILERMIRERGIRDYFVRLAGLSDLNARSKLDLGRKLISLLGLPPEEVLIAGDTTHDYEVSCDLGCACVLIEGGHQTLERLRTCGCPVLPGIEAIPGYIAEINRLEKNC